MSNNHQIIITNNKNNNNTNDANNPNIANQPQTHGGRPPHPYVHASIVSKILFIWPYHLMSHNNNNHNNKNQMKNHKKGRINTNDDSSVGGIVPVFSSSSTTLTAAMDTTIEQQRQQQQQQQQRAAIIEECDLPDVLPTDSSEMNLHRFQTMWENEKIRAAKVKERYLKEYQRRCEDFKARSRGGTSSSSSQDVTATALVVADHVVKDRDSNAAVVAVTPQRRQRRTLFPLLFDYFSFTSSSSSSSPSPQLTPPPPLVLPKTAYPSLHRALVKDFLYSTWFVQPCMLASSTARLIQALALGYLLQSFETTSPSQDDMDGEYEGDGGGGGGGSSSGSARNGYLWVGVLVTSGLIVLMEHHHVFFWTWRRGMQYRISCVAAIYEKSLRLNSMSVTEQLPASNTAKGTKREGKGGGSGGGASTSGKIVNLATNDVERFMMATLFASYIIWAPLQSLAILGLGWWVIGWSFAAGFGLLLFLFVPTQLWLSKRFADMRSRIAAITDERVTMVSQAVSGVRVMKISGWEESFQSRIASIRKREVEQIEHVNIYRVLNEAIFFVCNVTTSVCIFLIHVASGGILTPRSVFTTMVLINVAQMEITKHLSMGVMGVAECWVSISRIQRFLETPELEQQCEFFLDDKVDEKGMANTAIIVTNATCHWNGTGRSRSASTISSNCESEFDPMIENSFGLILALEDISLELSMGSLTCIIGSVGSGKSALIQMLAGELPLTTGSLRRRHCALAYAPQDPWIMDGTIKENILLGREFNSELYCSVVNACGLDVDMVQLRDGENTIVGDRGVQLSGGQRARIALARAFYQDADIILLDDPLSAVDSRVGRLLFFSAIQDLGVKRGKCIVLVTHQHQYIGASRCVMMSAGRVACVGSYQDCVEASDGQLVFAAQNQSAENLTKLDIPKALATNEEEESPREDAAKIKIASEINKPEDTTDDHKEQSQVGEVKRDTFLNYSRAMPGGIITGVLMIFLFTATQGSVLACIAAIGRWSGAPYEDQISGRNIGMVTGTVFVVIVLAVFRAFISFHIMIQASKTLHDDMTRAVLRAKIEFFDTNPLGRILNRFSSDVGSNDDQLPTTLFDFLVISFLVLGALVSAVAVLPVTLVFVPPLVWYFLRVRRIFVTTSRELKRLEGLARSPIFAMLSESLSGIATIRANNAIEHFQKKFRTIHDAHGRSFFAFIACSRWLGFRMDALMFTFLTIASFSAVLVHEKSWLDIDPGILGLVISLLIQLSGLFQWCIRQSAEVVNQMVAVERVLGYRDLPPEAALTTDFDKGVHDWPTKGEIAVNDLSVRYRKSLPLSLSGLTFHIESGSRVGIVGRTGCGKSTLVQCLLRLLEAEAGCIKIDGVDVSQLGLHKLRNCVSVIPQYPVLYGGCSLRENLDPFHQHDDQQIKDALTDVHMLEAVLSLSRGLDTTVAEGGLNFSVGQRQLLCLARAILRRNKILVLDEPTANVDARTDALLQEAVSKSFKGATILAVAHRLDTVIDYDKILVLGNGSVLEYGPPHELIMNGGAFCRMVDDTGKEMALDLKEQAKYSFDQTAMNAST